MLDPPLQTLFSRFGPHTIFNPDQLVSRENALSTGTKGHQATFVRYPFSMTTWVILAGLPATGKSMLAHALASRLNSVTLDKDRIRHAIFGEALTDYTQRQDDLVMRAMLDSAKYLTERKSVDFILFDGRTFSHSSQIDAVIGAAETAGAAWRILHLSCSSRTAEERLEREGAKHPAKNRDLALYRQIEQNFEPIPYAKLEIDTSQGFETKLDAILSYLHE
jgi:predicted kinase